jgi:hypothetical protein
VACRALFMAIKIGKSPVRAHLHLTPQEKANKTFVHFIARRYPVGIEDRGDIICICWHSKPSVSVRVDVRRSAAEVEHTLGDFLDARPAYAQPPGRHVPEWRQT